MQMASNYSMWLYSSSRSSTLKPCLHFFCLADYETENGPNTQSSECGNLTAQETSWSFSNENILAVSASFKHPSSAEVCTAWLSDVVPEARRADHRSQGDSFGLRMEGGSCHCLNTQLK